MSCPKSELSAVCTSQVNLIYIALTPNPNHYQRYLRPHFVYSRSGLSDRDATIPTMTSIGLGEKPFRRQKPQAEPRVGSHVP